jgi:hypothetical protein
MIKSIISYDSVSPELRRFINGCITVLEDNSRSIQNIELKLQTENDVISEV